MRAAAENVWYLLIQCCKDDHTHIVARASQKRNRKLDWLRAAGRCEKKTQRENKVIVCPIKKRYLERIRKTINTTVTLSLIIRLPSIHIRIFAYYNQRNLFFRFLSVSIGIVWAARPWLLACNAVQRLEEPFMFAVKEELRDRFTVNVETTYRTTIRFILSKLSTEVDNYQASTTA